MMLWKKQWVLQINLFKDRISGWPVFLLFTLVVAPQTFAQRIVQVSYAQDSKGDYVFSAENRAHCNYILEVRLTGLENIKSDQPMPFRKEVSPGNTKLFKLTPENRNNPVKFNFTTGHLKGCLKPEPNREFIYLLPMAPGKESQAYEMQNQQKSAAGEPEIRDWYVVRFKMSPGDTIYSARRGMVNEVDVSSGLNDAGSPTPGGGNYIEILHGDCSFGRYGIIRKDGSLVKPGQFVEAGVPIGIVGGDRFGRGSEIRFSVSYNEEVFDAQGGEKQYEDFLLLYFWIKYKGKEKLKHGATYLSEHPAQIKTQEIAKPASKKKPATKSKKS